MEKLYFALNFSMNSDSISFEPGIFFRLHDSSEKILDNPNSQDAKLRRKRRHHLRLFLLVLDYIVESVGSIVIFIVVFVANKSILQQHVLTTVGSFVYGVPIPLSYLLSETRIRVIIIENGWFQGFKAIFQSSEGIKQSKIDKIVECSHNDKELIGKFFNISKKNTTNNQTKCEFESISRDGNKFKVNYNFKKGIIENNLISKSAFYDHTDYPLTSDCSEISYNPQHKLVDEIDLKLKNTGICRSSSYKRAIHSSRSKCSDIYYDSKCNRVDEIEFKIEGENNLSSDSNNRAIQTSRGKNSDISYISNRKAVHNLDLKTLVVSNIRLDADIVISMEPEIDTFENPVRPDIDTVNDPKVNRKHEIITNHYGSMDEITVIDVEVIEELSRVGCRNDSIESISRYCVDRDVEMIERLAITT